MKDTKQGSFPVESNNNRKKPLPVGLTKAQHEYLESQDVGKAEYMRNLLIIDMEKNK